MVVADAGYWHQVQMENVINQGMQVLMPPDALKRRVDHVPCTAEVAATPGGWPTGSSARILDEELRKAERWGLRVRPTPE
ncbi:MAG: hypothetical protein H0U25_01065 [Thermoleophilaceae bacterium]|nr:hypothetical protein [Thermoleophilaceae bacterium]